MDAYLSIYTAEFINGKYYIDIYHNNSTIPAAAPIHTEVSKIFYDIVVDNIDNFNKKYRGYFYTSYATYDDDVNEKDINPIIGNIADLIFKIKKYDFWKIIDITKIMPTSMIYLDVKIISDYIEEISETFLLKLNFKFIETPDSIKIITDKINNEESFDKLFLYLHLFAYNVVFIDIIIKRIKIIESKQMHTGGATHICIDPNLSIYFPKYNNICDYHNIKTEYTFFEQIQTADIMKVFIKNGINLQIKCEPKYMKPHKSAEPDLNRGNYYCTYNDNCEYAHEHYNGFPKNLQTFINNYLQLQNEYIQKLLK